MRRVLAGVLAASALLAAVAIPGAASAEAPEPYVVAVGDIACAQATVRTATACHEDATAALFGLGGALAGPDLRAVLVLGDAQYPSGKYSDFTYVNANCSVAPVGTGPCSFQGSFGSSQATTAAEWRPTTGNHEYKDPTAPFTGCRLQATTAAGLPYQACGYEQFFGSDVVAPTVNGNGKGNYAFQYDVGAPHPILFLSLNVGQCDKNAAYCSATGPVVAFVQQTLASPTLNPAEACVVVYWHQPRWSAYGHANYGKAGPIWQALFAPLESGRPDLVLNGHSHGYQRFRPISKAGLQGTSASSIPEIIVGTGGANLQPTSFPTTTNKPGAPLVSDLDTYGILRLGWSSAAGTLSTAFYAAGATTPTDTAIYSCR